MLGAILMSATGGPRLQIPVGSVVDSFLGGAQASIAFTSDGDVTTTTLSDGAVDAGDWIVPKGAAPGPYTIRATVTSGSLDEGTADTDLALTSTRSFSVVQAGAGTKSATVTFQLKLGSSVLASRSVTLSATGL